MSRTHRKTPIWRPIRSIRTQSTHINEIKAVEQLKEYGFDPTNRLVNRSENLINSNDDLNVSSYDQMDFANNPNGW